MVKLILMIFAGAFIIYRVTTPLGNFFFFSIIFLGFLITAKSIFWTALLFIVLSIPWGLFYYIPFGWYIRLTPQVGISFASVFGILFLVKALFFLRRDNFLINDRFASYYKPMAFFIVFLFFWSFVFGHDQSSIFKIVQFFPAFLLFAVIPRFFGQNELVRFNQIIFVFTLIHFAGNLVELIFPGSFLPVIFFGKPPTGVYVGEGIIRFFGSISLHLYGMIVGLYYISIRHESFKNWYLWLVVILSYVFILNSATRGWMIASSFLLFGYALHSALYGNLSPRTLTSVFIIVVAGYLLIPESLERNLGAAFDRLETLESITEGDATAGGTLSRITHRGPRVLSKFSESPFLGFGFSKVTSEYYDGHVGNHSILLMGGLAGFAILLGTVLRIIWFFFRLDYKKPGNGFIVFGLGVIAIMIIHSTSRTMVSFYMPSDAAFLIGLILNNFNAVFAGESIEAKIG